jgi:hypothetical protein
MAARQFHGLISSRIEKHHHCYLRLYIGQILPEDSRDIYGLVKSGKFLHVPDCRQCKIDHPEYYEGCIKKYSLFTANAMRMESHLFVKLFEKMRNHFLPVTTGHHIK